MKKTLTVEDRENILKYSTKDNWKSTPDLEREFHLSFRAIQRFRLKNHLFSPSIWSENEKIFLKENYKKISDGEIGKILGRTKSAVSHIRLTLRLFYIRDSRKIKKCSNCGKEVKYYSPKLSKDTRQFCNRSCRWEYARHSWKRICFHCKKEFISKSPNKFCSLECRISATKAKHVYPKICVGCGKKFNAPYSHRKYCTGECYYLNRSKKVEKICPFCGKKFCTHDKEKKYCGEKCFILSRRITITHFLREVHPEVLFEYPKWKYHQTKRLK